MSCIYIYIYLPLLLSWQKQKSLSHLYPPKRMCYFEPGRLWCGDQGGNAKGYGMVTFAEISCGYECHLIFYVHLLCQCDSVWEEWGDGHIYPECVFFQMLNFRSWKSWGLFSRCFWWWILLKDIKTHYLRRTFMARNGNDLEKDRVNSALLTVLLTLWLLLGVPCWILYAKCLVGYLACCEVYRTLPFGKIVVERNACWRCF